MNAQQPARTQAGKVLEFASDAEAKAQERLDKSIKEGNAHESKAMALEWLAWRTVRDRAYCEAHPDERAEWMRKQTGAGT